MKKILVIEDTHEHMANAKKFFEGKDVEVVYAKDYSEIKFDGINGVISDIYFPLRTGDRVWGQPEPIGVSVMIRCKEKNIPCILNTAGYHHGSKYQWICDLQRDLRLPEIVDASGDYFEDANEKDWAGAFDALSEIMK